jgi:hypothetical protein
MKKLAWLVAAAAVLALAGCPDEVKDKGDEDDAQGGNAGSGGHTGGTGNAGSGGVPGPSTSDKVDILLVVDNSRAMGEKQRFLAEGIPELLSELSSLNVDDIHIGVISSSLGGLGSDVCEGSGDPSENDHGRLVFRAPSGGSVATYQNLGFLAWDPNGELTPPGESSEATLIANAADLIAGAGQVGCGYESQLESAYRFLVDPSPYESIVMDNGQAVPTGVDQALLDQRAQFLRPDSLLVVVVATDENDCSTRAGGQFFFSRQIYQPGTNNPYHLPGPRAACAADPANPCCKSCGQSPEPGCDESMDQCGDTLSALEDSINMRCFDQKRRFGIDFLWPLDRYVAGFSYAQVPDAAGNVVPNPLFPSGGRGSELVVFTAIAGVPWQLLDANPANAARTGQELESEGKWDTLVGDPTSFVAPGDAHMVESIEPRAGLAGPGQAASADPMHGHEYSTPNRDGLQFACLFDLGAPIDCEVMFESCDCTDAATDSPACQNPSTNQFGTTQYRSFATPSIRPLALVRELGGRGVAGSICPAEVADTTSAGYGYRPSLAALFDVVQPRLELP